MASEIDAYFFAEDQARQAEREALVDRKEVAHLDRPVQGRSWRLTATFRDGQDDLVAQFQQVVSLRMGVVFSV